MKTFWKIAIPVTCVAVICAAAIAWQVHERKLTEATRVCRASAEHGNAKAQYKLGGIYYYGNGIPKDYAEAARWYRKAADQGDAKAEYGIGYMYDGGLGLPQDFTEALRWYRKAADQDDAQAQGGLGSMYYDGRAVPQDRAEAARWYRKAADQGRARAQYDLGYMYYYGQGVPQDRAEADRWYHKAADQGYAYAQQALGLRGRKWSTFSKINNSIIPLGCLMLLIGSLSPGWRLQNRHQRAEAIAALLGLTTVGMSLYWVFCALPSISAVNAFFFAKELLGGIFVAMLISLFIPKTAKIVLGISGILFIGLNLLLIVLIDTKRFIPVRAFCSFNGIFIGLSIPLAIFLWRTHKKSREEENLDSEDAAPELLDENERDSNQV